MHNIRVILGLLLILAIFFIFFEKEIPTDITYADKHFSFYASKSDYGDLENKNYVQKKSDRIYGGIVSHHLLANKKIADFFAEFRDQKVKTVVLIGPNHYGIGEENILISQYPYETPWGIVKPDVKIIEKIIYRSNQFTDEQPFSKEHSISSLVPYISFNFPDAKIIPIIIKSGTSRTELDNLIRILSKELPEDSIVISSVDFSHHLNKLAANYHDAMTIPAIQTFNYGRLFKSEIDSPESIYVLLKILEYKQAQKMEYSQENAANILEDENNQDVTSYLFAHFTRGEKKKINNISLLNFGNINIDIDVIKFTKSYGDPFINIRGVEGNFLKGTDYIISGMNFNQDLYLNADLFLKYLSAALIENNFNILGIQDSKLIDGYFVNAENKDKSFNKESVYLVKTIDETELFFISINGNLSQRELENFYKKIRESKNNNTIITVNIYWDSTNNFYPSENQISIARKLIDSGADIIIGTNPNTIQKIEIYNNKAIFYSLGNLISPETNSKTSNGFGVGVIYNDGKYEYYLFPLKIKNFKPAPLPSIEEKEFCDYLLIEIENKNKCYFRT